MYCKRCYAALSAADAPRCPNCKRLFDPAKPKTFLERPFPSAGRVVLQIFGTTILGIAAAYLVALHQAARNSGH
jgi:hypothetical protein